MGTPAAEVHFYDAEKPTPATPDDALPSTANVVSSEMYRNEHKKKEKENIFFKRPGATVAGAAGLRGAGLRLPGRRWRGAGVADVDVVHRRPVPGVPAVHHHGHRRRPPPRTRHLARARRRTPRPLHRRLRPRRLAYYRVLPSFPY